MAVSGDRRLLGAGKGVEMTETVNFDLNLFFLWKCLRVYWGKVWPLPLLFLAGMGLCLVICLRKKKTVPGVILLYWTLVLAVLIYNPLSVRLMVPRIVKKAFFYRLFWLIPVIPGLAYLFTLCAEVLRGRSRKILAATVILAGLFLIFPVNGELLKGIRRPDNIYKIPDSVVFACEEIHRDYTDEERLPKTVWAFELEVYVRQYDPSIRLTIGRNTRLRYAGSVMVGKAKKNKKYMRRVSILDGINDTGEVTVKAFRKAMKKTHTDYLVIPVSYTSHDFLKKAGCTVTAENDDVVVYRFDWH